jgi:beta-glucosidase
LVVGYHADDEGENLTSNRKPVKNPTVPRGGDRASLHLPDTQQRLIDAVCNANANTVVTLIAGSAVMMNHWQDKPAAILFAGYPGMEGGHALTNILFGDTTPSGKLSFTIPADEKQLPAFDRWAATAHYDYFHGYTLAHYLEQAPAFAFGFGLSYTTFSIDNLHIQQQDYHSNDTINISITISNTGAHRGAEVVQCYIGQSNPDTRPSPTKRLFAFEKIWLEAGEQKTVTLHIPVQQLARYHPDERTWQVEPGQYTVWVGNSSTPEHFRTICITSGS